MPIEPISGVISFQSQNYQPSQTTKTNHTVEKTAAEVNAVPQDGTQPVDSTTVTVKQTEESGLNKDGGGKQGGQYTDAQEKQATNLVAESNSQILQKEHERLKAAVEEMNKKMANSEAQFGIHEATNRVTIKIIDKDTKEVIKELPPEKTLDLIAKTLEMAGLLVDERR